MENEEKAERLIELVKKARTSMPPRPHEIRTPEHGQECIECREWSRAAEASFKASIEGFEKEEGMTSGDIGILMFMALSIKANALTPPPPQQHTHTSSEERKHCLECQEWDKARAATWEKLRDDRSGGLVKELASGLEWYANAKAAMLPVANVLGKAINDGELEIPEHRQTHKSQEELLACDICQDWKRRRDAILEKGLGSKPDWL